MSLNPLPVHMSCYGISQDTVAACRGYAKSGQAQYADRVRGAIAAAAATQASASAAAAQPAASSRAAAQASPSRSQAPQVKLQPLGAEQASALMGGGGGGGGMASSSAPATTAAYRSHTKHQSVTPLTLQSLDFSSIADSSVGGGGLPRPYAKFQASRAGDGNATYQRMPPAPGSWQSKALPIAVTLLTDEDVAAASAAEAAAQQAYRQRYASAGPRTDGRHRDRPELADPDRDFLVSGGHRGGPASTSTTSSMSSPERVAETRRSRSHQPRRLSANFGSGGPPAGFATGAGTGRLPTSYPHHNPHHINHGQAAKAALGAGASVLSGGAAALAKEMNSPSATIKALQEQYFYRRPGSSMHRSLVPLPPPEPHNPQAWFALPSATFLTDMPTVPENLRMDNGYSVSRDFLISGLNKGKPRPKPPAPSPPMSPASHWGPSAGGGPPGSAAGSQHPASNAAATGSGHVGPEVRLEDKHELWSALEKGGQVVHVYPPVVGPLGLRGVYIPIDNRAAILAAQSSQWNEEQQLAEEQAQWAEAAAWEEEQAALAAAAGDVRGSLQFPPEGTLPRRNVPSGW